MISAEDNTLKELLTEFVYKLDTNTLSCDEKMNLIQLYIQHNSACDMDIATDENILKYTTLGWYVSTFFLKK